MRHLRLVKPAAPKALAYENRRGETYYLHEGRTKTGKPRYFFAKSVREGALEEMPEGHEVSESVNGVVSVRRKRPGERSVPDEHLEHVRVAMKRHPRLRDHQVRTVKDAIVVFEPNTTREQLRGYDLGWRQPSEAFVDKWMKKARYSPVLKFEIAGDGYAVFRMTYRGEGGWSYPLAHGTVDELATGTSEPSAPKRSSI